jgi:hypothetical protein
MATKFVLDMGTKGRVEAGIEGGREGDRGLMDMTLRLAARTSGLQTRLTMKAKHLDEKL